MDAKCLAEIKARCDEGRPTARIDVKALIAEVERLKAENADYHHMEKVVEGQQNQNTRLRRIIEQKDQQTAMLEKALELACKDHADQCTWMAGTATTDELMQYYIREAQEQEGNHEKS